LEIGAALDAVRRRSPETIDNKRRAFFRSFSTIPNLLVRAGDEKSEELKIPIYAEKRRKIYSSTNYGQLYQCKSGSSRTTELRMRL
jgi:hypothetical protein